MSELNVLLVITELPLGGAQSHVLDLARGLSVKNHRVHLATGGEGPLGDASNGSPRVNSRSAI